MKAALWTAVRTFREKAVRGRQMAAAERDKGNERTAGRFEEHGTQAAEYAELIIEHVLAGNGGTDQPPAQDSAP